MLSFLQTQWKLLPETPVAVKPSPEENMPPSATMQLPMCVLDMPSEFQIRLSRPFVPFESKRDVKTQEIDEIENSEPPRYTVVFAGTMPKNLEEEAIIWRK